MPLSPSQTFPPPPPPPAAPSSPLASNFRVASKLMAMFFLLIRINGRKPWFPGVPGSVSVVLTVKVPFRSVRLCTIIAPRLERVPAVPPEPRVITFVGLPASNTPLPIAPKFCGLTISKSTVLLLPPTVTFSWTVPLATPGFTNTWVAIIRPDQLTTIGPTTILAASAVVFGSTRTASPGLFGYRPSAPKFPLPVVGPMISTYVFIPGVPMSGMM
ncbi:MAG: hypothetical protein DYG96_07365 [Chlorobi bacterium CHB2]|nr:hypothetical protein [Chlorobi bacterium CHB2]